MKKNLLFFFCLVFLSFTTSCSAGNRPEPPPSGGGTGSGTEEEPEVEEFYANAFKEVPATIDIRMYQVNPRVFAEKNSLKEVTKQLERIRELSVNVIWLMPINELGIEKASNSPYCIKDYKKLDPEFGTLEDLRELVEKAHGLGMAVIMDWVANHTSWDNEWITKHRDWYTKDGNGNIVSPNTSWKDVADLNFDSPELRKEMINAMKYWIYQANIDGYRCDAADMVPSGFWSQAIAALRGMDQERDIIMLAEGTDTANFYAGFDIDYGWDYLKKIKSVYSENGSVLSLITSHENEYKAIPAGKRKLRFTTNHDEAVNYSPVNLYGGQKGSLSAFVLTICTGGNPLIYSSQEIGYISTINFFKFVPMNWSNNAPVWEEYKQIMKVFSENSALSRGELQSYSDQDVACLLRTYQDEEALVLVNSRNNENSLTIPAELVGEKWLNTLTGETIILTESIELEPYQYRIFSRSKLNSLQ